MIYNNVTDSVHGPRLCSRPGTLLPICLFSARFLQHSLSLAFPKVHSSFLFYVLGTSQYFFFILILNHESSSNILSFQHITSKLRMNHVLRVSQAYYQQILWLIKGYKICYSYYVYPCERNRPWLVFLPEISYLCFVWILSLSNIAVNIDDFPVWGLVCCLPFSFFTKVKKNMLSFRPSTTL